MAKQTSHHFTAWIALGVSVVAISIAAYSFLTSAGTNLGGGGKKTFINPTYGLCTLTDLNGYTYTYSDTISGCYKYCTRMGSGCQSWQWTP